MESALWVYLFCSKSFSNFDWRNINFPKKSYFSNLRRNEWVNKLGEWTRKREIKFNSTYSFIIICIYPLASVEIICVRARILCTHIYGAHLRTGNMNLIRTHIHMQLNCSKALKQCALMSLLWLFSFLFFCVFHVVARSFAARKKKSSLSLSAFSLHPKSIIFN